MMDDTAHIDDETGKAALAACIAAAFGDTDGWQASIPARDDDSDIVASRWARQLLARAEAAEARVRELEAPGECQSLHKLRARAEAAEAERETWYHVACLGTDSLRDERDALAAELAAMRGERDQGAASASMACESPADDCDCPGCQLAAERAAGLVDE